MRLIDADKLIAFIDVGKYTNPNVITFSENDVCEMINNQPTAYDVEKVVEEIEEYTCKECKEAGTDKRFYYGMGCKACAFGKILQIVKRGGVE